MNRQTHMESYMACNGLCFMVYRTLHKAHFKEWVLHKCLHRVCFRVAVNKEKRSMAIHSYLLLPVDTIEVPID